MAYGYDEGVNILELMRLWQTTHTRDEIQNKLGVDRKKLQRLIKKHKLPKRPRLNDRADHGERKPDEPTEEEIAQKTAEIRSKWTDQDYVRRAVHKTSSEWSAPICSY